MNYLQAIWEYLPQMEYTDILDILIVAFLIYILLPIFRSTGTTRIAWVAVGAIIISSLTELLELHALHFVLKELLAVGLIAIVVLFQPELRRMLDQVTHIKLKHFFGVKKADQEMLSVITQAVRACEVMGREKIGALIVFARSSRMDEYCKSGTIIDGQVSEQLIRNVFFPRASLHDGAMIIREGRVLAAGCVLPLSESDRINADLGTRHRAAVGISEVTDAVTVIVSEETGAISVAVNGMLKRHLAPQMLERLLRNELCPETEQKQEENLVVKLRQKLQNMDKGGKKDAQ